VVTESSISPWESNQKKKICRALFEFLLSTRATVVSNFSGYQNHLKAAAAAVDDNDDIIVRKGRNPQMEECALYHF
jgi:hypothetical protein